MKKKKSPSGIRVPKAEVARQATDAWGGYGYQLEHTVVRWLKLGDDDQLLVEVSEDYGVTAEGRLDLAQIKRTKANITLRSEAVEKLIAAVWAFQNENLDRKVTGVLLTTSGIGKEKNLKFPGGEPGLIYWRTAARGGQLEPLRAVLLELDLPKDLHAFIKTASATDLRARILQPIQWLDKAPSPVQLRQDVEDRLIIMGDRMRVAAASAVKVRSHLMTALLDVIPKAQALRYVNKAALIRIFQDSTYITMAPAVLEQLVMAGVASGTAIAAGAITRDIAEIPLPRRNAERKALVDELREKLIASGTLWFDGSSGLGKSTLAFLVARSQGEAWRMMDLRELPPTTVRSMLIGAADNFHETGARGLILDDLPADPDSALISAIDQLARAVTDADGVLIVTGPKAPPPTLAARLNLNANQIITVPYLTEEDVAGMVTDAGGDPAKWARVVHSFSGGGHPQLVDAKIAGLAQRGWDPKEMLADILPLEGAPDDLGAERQTVRNRLLQILSSEENELLMRLSLLLGRFDRQMAMAAAETPTAIARPGQIFDFLVGPWIERVGDDRYRLSPLLQNSGAATLSDNQQRAVKLDVMRDLMKRRPFPADQLLQVFASAISVGDREGLSWFGHAVLTASMKEKKSNFKLLSQSVSAFALVDYGEGKPLVPGDLPLSRLLRFAQLRVAVAADDMKQAVKLIDRALAEDEYVAVENRPMYRAMIYSTALLETRVPLSPRRWLPMLKKLVAMAELHDKLTEPMPTGGGYDGLPPDATHEEMLFIGRAGALKSVTELGELIEVLEQQPKAVRDRYLGVAARVTQSFHLIVAASWLAEVKKSDFDAKAAAATFRKLSQSQLARENAELAVELLCAEAVMLDEYAEDEAGALDVLSAAQEAYPNDYRINRQRQKVYYRHKRYAEALAEVQKFKDRMPKQRAVDTAYTMREAGRSAAEVGDLKQALEFFGDAWEAARLCSDAMKPMVAGLSADCAIVAFDAGDEEGAVALMQRALQEADGLDPKKGLKEAFLRRVQLAAIIYMRGNAPDFPLERHARIYGMCSEPEPNEWWRNQPQPDPNLAWYMLAELEAEVSKGHAVLDELRVRTKGSALLFLEMTLASHAIEQAIRNRDVDRFMDWIKTYPRAVILGAQVMRSNSTFTAFNLASGKVAPIEEREWAQPNIAEVTRKAVMFFMICAAAEGRADEIVHFRARLDAIPGLRDVVRDLFEVMDEPSDEHKNEFVIIPSIAGRLLIKYRFDAEELFSAAVYTLQVLQGSSLSPPVAEAMMKVFEAQWPEVIAKMSFSMRSPSTNGPIILDAMRRGEMAIQRMANMVLAAEAAVKASLPDEMRAKFAKTAAPRVRIPLSLDDS